ncbi:unnamed protein product [Camellia sinensis]
MFLSKSKGLTKSSEHHQQLAQELIEREIWRKSEEMFKKRVPRKKLLKLKDLVGLPNGWS